MVFEDSLTWSEFIWYIYIRPHICRKKYEMIPLRFITKTCQNGREKRCQNAENLSSLCNQGNRDIYVQKKWFKRFPCFQCFLPPPPCTSYCIIRNVMLGGKNCKKIVWCGFLLQYSTSKAKKKWHLLVPIFLKKEQESLGKTVNDFHVRVPTVSVVWIEIVCCHHSST